MEIPKPDLGTIKLPDDSERELEGKRAGQPGSSFAETKVDQKKKKGILGFPEIRTESVSQELKEMFEADQEDRKNWKTSGIDWDAIKPRDDARLQRVEELYSQGLLQTADDMYHAAMIYQHGDKPEHYQKAIELARKAGELGHPDGKTFSCLAEDRYLLEIGKPQIWGTQFTRDNENEPWKLREPFDRNAKTDNERKEMGLTDIEEKLRDLNK